MRPNDFILVGGPSRSGTNTASVFLHIHEEICMYNTLEVKLGFELSKSTNLAECVSRSKAFQRAFGIENSYWGRLLDIKNQKIDKGRYIGLRWDYCEHQYDHFKKALPGKNIKLIYCMRDPHEVLASLIYHDFIPKKETLQETAERFFLDSKNSFTMLNKVQDFFPLDITNGLNYWYMMDYLGLKPNKNQKLWINDVPVVNRNGKEETEDYENFIEEVKGTVKFPSEILEGYETLRRRAK